MSGWMSVADQKRRASEIERLGGQRRLTPDELTEYDNLAHRSYMRNWRAQERERWGRR